MIGEDILDLGGQVALVTGAGQGAGRGIFNEFSGTTLHLSNSIVMDNLSGPVASGELVVDSVMK